jgi:hypothetical protein
VVTNYSTDNSVNKSFLSFIFSSLLAVFGTPMKDVRLLLHCHYTMICYSVLNYIKGYMWLHFIQTKLFTSFYIFNKRV